MDNRLFFILLSIPLLGWFGWMGYDAWAFSKAGSPVAGMRGDLLGSPGSSPARVRYLYRFAEPAYSHELDSKGIDSIRMAGSLAEGAKVRGLTVADFGMDSLYQFRIRKRWFKGDYLAWVEDLKVDFSYRSMKVYLAREHAEGSCEYNETKWHEEEHVRIHRETYAKYQPLLEEAVLAAKDIPLKSAPITVSGREEGRKVVGERISSVLDPVFERFNGELQAEQAKIDTEASYKELGRHCPGW